MADYTVSIRITPRAGLLDPEGKAIKGALGSLGFAGIADVRVGRLIRIELAADSEQAARAAAEDMCQKLLANPVTEDYAVEVERAAAPVR